MIIERIKQFFKNLFSVNKKKYIEAPKEVGINTEYTKENKHSNFKEEISIKNEEDRILNLQKEFKEGNIKAEEISEKDIDLLIETYLRQITQKLKKIQEYETKMEINIKN